MNIHKYHKFATSGILSPSFEVSISQSEAKQTEIAFQFLLEKVNANDKSYLLEQISKFEHHTIKYFCIIFNFFQNKANFHIFEDILALENSLSIRLLIPTPGLDPSTEVLLYQKISSFLMKKDTRSFEAINKLITKLYQLYKSPSNIGHMLKASQELKIPFWRASAGMIRFGNGKNTFWTQSTFTCNTPITSAKIARDKLLCSSVLERAGLPVAPKIPLQNDASIDAFINRYGFPLVVKPRSFDGGKLVYADIKTKAELYSHIKKIQRTTNAILLEKHIEGQDVRCQVINGKVVWSVLREPAYVIGDGTSTLGELIDNKYLQQKDKNRISHIRSLPDKQDIINHLQKHNLNLDSILTNNKKMKIISIANVSLGGSVRAINDIIHPDNKKLAEDTVELLGLDIAGVDILLKDPGRSWKEIGGVVCEINACPQFGIDSHKHLYSEYLNTCVPNNGEIPIFLVLGNEDTLSRMKRVQQKLDIELGLNVPLCSSLELSECDLATQLHQKLSNRRTDFILIHSDSTSYLNDTWGVARFDYILVDDIECSYDYNFQLIEDNNLTNKIINSSSNKVEFSSFIFDEIKSLNFNVR